MPTLRQHLTVTAAAAVLAAFVVAPSAARQAAAPALPDTPSALTAPPTIATLEAVLGAADARDRVTVTEEGRSAGDRPVRLVHLDRSAGGAAWRVLLVAGERGDEPAGVAALAFLVRDVAAAAERLPGGVDLWVIPLLNPDGYAAGRPTNDAGADLGRDHLLLAQPETRILHDVARRVQADMVVDLREFDRTPPGYASRGWTEWPDVTMDTANAPLLDPSLYEVGLHWVDAVSEPLDAAGFNFARTTVGGAPPGDAQHPATLDADDARNSIAAATGCLAFTVESGVRRTAADSSADLGRRVDAQLRVVRALLANQELRGPSREAVAVARAAELPPFLPTDSFWANAGLQVSRVKVVDSASGATREIATANLMHQRIVESSVSAPVAWAVTAAQAPAYRALLDRHGITYQVLGSATDLRAERCRLERVEDETDPLEHREGGRQIVTREPAADHTFGAGALLVFPDQPERVLAALLLEPSMLYGLYRYPELRTTVAADGTIPVWRVVGAGQ